MDAERFRKFACLVHFKHDVAAPHEGRLDTLVGHPSQTHSRRDP